MLRQLILFAAVAAIAMLLARLIPPANPIAVGVRYSLYLVSLVATGLLVWVILAATVFAEV